LDDAGQAGRYLPDLWRSVINTTSFTRDLERLNWPVELPVTYAASDGCRNFCQRFILVNSPGMKTEVQMKPNFGRIAQSGNRSTKGL